MSSKQPPHDIEAEEQVIGSLLIDGSAIDKVADWLDPHDFFSDELARLYQICLELDEDEQPINLITVGAYFEDKSYLEWLIGNCPTSLDIEFHARTVRRLAQARRLISVGKQITQLAYQLNHSVDDALSEAHFLLDDVRRVRPPRLRLKNPVIIQSNPRHYKLMVNGKQISLAAEELQWARFRDRIIDVCDFIPLKPKKWGRLVDKLLTEATKEEAPVDAHPEVEVALSVKRWFEQRGEGDSLEHIRGGCYVVVGSLWAFQPRPLLKWLKRDIDKRISSAELWSVLLQFGVEKIVWHRAKLWALPRDFADNLEFGVAVVKKK